MSNTSQLHIQDPTTTERRGLCSATHEPTRTLPVAWKATIVNPDEPKGGRITCPACRSIHNRRVRIEEVHCMRHADVAAYMHEIGHKYE